MSMTRRLPTALLTMALPAVALGSAAPARAAGVDVYCFAKHAVAPGVWQGTYAEAAADGSCDPTGGSAMTSALTSAPKVTGDTMHITIRWRFLDAAGDLVFQTDQKGVLDLVSGDVVLNGTVTAGAPLGARTHDEGHPTDAFGSYAGLMRVQ